MCGEVVERMVLSELHFALGIVNVTICFREHIVKHIPEEKLTSTKIKIIHHFPNPLLFLCTPKGRKVDFTL